MKGSSTQCKQSPRFFGGFFVSNTSQRKGIGITYKKKAQTNVVWADTSIGVNKENAVIKKAVRRTSLTAC
ncbi:transposase [Vibrio crassostreae]|nr:transposase [Vibrio crassostreae]